jgi:3-hydroxybutyryl-CoA dehydrogenase
MIIEEIKRIGVVGAGLMGHGIAQEFALAGYKVSLHDVNDEKLKKAEETIRNNLRMLSDVGLITRDRSETLHENLHVTTSLEDAAGTSDVIIEAAFEDLKLKQAIFRDLDKWCPKHAILASNSSTLLPSSLASATTRPDKVLIAHYFNPPYLVPLVEIVRHAATSDETVNTMFNLLKKVGKKPVVLQKEAPGFVGNRLQAALFREALSIVEQGIATPEDVDNVIKNGFGRRLAAAGIFEIWEIAGWDLILTICENLFPVLESSGTVSPVLRGMVERGELGVKAGKGFYEWSPDSIQSLRKRIARILVNIAREAG